MQGGLLVRVGRAVLLEFSLLQSVSLGLLRRLTMTSDIRAQIESANAQIANAFKRSDAAAPPPFVAEKMKAAVESLTDVVD
jgi:hypothetical protein